VIAGLIALGAGTAGLVWLTGHAGKGFRASASAASPTARSADLTGPSPFAATSGLAAEPPGRRAAPVAARPVSLTIPAIGVHARLTQLGLTSRGALQVPASPWVPGWYSGGPRPGEIGPAIIAGHIDSLTGPGVFFRLRLLRPGDLASVRRADGTVAVFRVYAERMYAKDRFPTAEVYGPTPDAELRLITCGGAFDTAAGSYLSNVVVYASQVR
ncbi:MAG TPA: class F sortase, partial [Streptosporangiaceae bacterium]